MKNIKMCYYHKGRNSHFYCFDDQQFLCDTCFKDHKSHDLEVISEIEKNEMIYRNLNGNNAMTNSLEEIRDVLNELKDNIGPKLETINYMLSFLNNSALSSNFKSIFFLNYREYEKLEKYLKLIESLDILDKKLAKLEKFKLKKEYINFREIDKEVNLIENSNVNTSLNFDIILGEKSNNPFFEVPKNHFAIIDLKKDLYLKEILLSVKQNNGCVLKNFKVSTKNNDGIWEEVNSFIYENNKNEKEEDIQQFPIEKETQFVRIDFIDAWSNDGGNSVFIRKLSFKVADIINRK